MPIPTNRNEYNVTIFKREGFDPAKVRENPALRYRIPAPPAPSATPPKTVPAL